VNPEEKNRAGNASTADQARDDLKQIKHLLRQAVPPLPSDQLQPRTDLWPQLRSRIESQLTVDRAANTNHEPSSIRIRVHWFDWALAALAAAALLFFPGIIPSLLYHF
jgi:hypothetical protein